jgi:ribosome biogenesis protein Nip4
MRANNKGPKFMNFTKLNSQRKTDLIKTLESDYGYDTNFLNEYIFYITSKDKIMLSKIDVDKLKLERVNSLGIYFGIYHSETKFRLSLEGSKMIKPTKNFIKIDDKAMKSYVTAENLFEDEVQQIKFSSSAPFKIVQYKKDNLGCMSHRDKEFLTYLSKSRKLDFGKVF